MISIPGYSQTFIPHTRTPVDSPIGVLSFDSKSVKLGMIDHLIFNEGQHRFNIILKRKLKRCGNAKREMRKKKRWIYAIQLKIDNRQSIVNLVEGSERDLVCAKTGKKCTNIVVSDESENDLEGWEFMEWTRYVCTGDENSYMMLDRLNGTIFFPYSLVLPFPEF